MNATCNCCVSGYGFCPFIGCKFTGLFPGSLFRVTQFETAMCSGSHSDERTEAAHTSNYTRNSQVWVKFLMHIINSFKYSVSGHPSGTMYCLFKVT